MIARLERMFLWLGAAGTLLLIALILWRGGRNGISAVVVGLALWMLSPYLGVLHQRRSPATTAREQAISLVIVMLIVAYGGYAYLSGWVFYRGPTRSTAQGMIAVLVPMYQWAALAIGATRRWGVRVAVRRRGRGHAR